MAYLLIPVAVITILWFSIKNPVLVQRDNSINLNIQQSYLSKHVEFLCNQKAPRSFENTESLNIVANYISENFADFGLEVYRQPYSDNNYHFQNIIAQYKPALEQRVIIGAHYDVCGPFAGADDNASGIAGLLEIARLISQEQPEIDYGIDFIAYSTEEPPYFRTHLMGSAVHADFIAKHKIDIKLMIVLEMIRYYNTKPKSQNYPIPALKYLYPETADFIAIVGRTKEFKEVRKFKKNMIKSANIKVESINTPIVFEGIDFSDHRNYWNNDIKAIMITNTSFFRNENYHTKFDLPETLDFEKMTEVVKGVYYSLVNLK